MITYSYRKLTLKKATRLSIKINIYFVKRIIILIFYKILLAKKKKCGINKRVEKQTDCSSAW